MRWPVVLVCVIAATTAVRAGEMPRSIGLYPTSGPALAMVDSQIDVTVRGPIVEAVITQRFQNRTDHATEATYVFPLPVDAAVSALTIKHGSRTIHGAVARREEAQRRYEDAVRAGTHAALLDQERPDVFTQTVAAIPARGTVDITLRFDTVAQYRAGTWELVLPLVVAPRYVPGAATNRPTTGTGRSPDTNRAPDASRITPPGAPGAGGSTTIALHFTDKPTDLTSPTHELRAFGANAKLVDPRTDHDAIVRWRAPASAAGWVESAADGGYAAVVVEAPAPAKRTGPIRCMLVLDRSAAARGDADAIAHPLVRDLLGAMLATDRVAVAGSDQLAWAAPADIARSLEQTWSTPARAFDLTRTLTALRSDGAPVVLVSGGLVADDRAAITAAAKLGVPIHVIGVGPAPARGVLVRVAAASGGTVRFAGPDDDLGALARAAIADAASPPAPLTVTWGTLAASDVVPGTLPRLGAGQAMLVLARVKRAQTANARARGELFAIETLPRARPVEGATTTMGPLARRWARNRLDELLAGRTHAAVVTAHALRYGLVSPYTSMVAIGDEVVVQGGVKRSVAVPVSVPAGMKWQQVKKQTTVDTTTARVEGDARDKNDRVATSAGREVGREATEAKDDKVPRRPPVVVQRSPQENKPRVRAKPREPISAGPTRHGHRPTPDAGGPYRPTTPRPEPPPAKPSPAATAQGQDRPRGGVVHPVTGTSVREDPRPISRKAKKGDVDASGEDDDSDGDRMADDEALEPAAPKDVAAADAPAAYGGEVAVVQSMGRGRRWRLATTLGAGGLRLDGETATMVALGARFDVALARRVAFGPEASLWLVDGELAGNTHLTFALALVRRLELGLGFGVHFADAVVAPALTTSLRYHATPRFGGFLRYDGALIDDAANARRRGQQTFSLGLELDF